MSDIRQWIAWTEERLAILMISEGLDVGLAQVIQGPMTVTYRLRLLQPSRASLAKLLSLAPAIGQALQTSNVRISDSAKGILVEIPSPRPRTPAEELLAKVSRGLLLACGLDSFREPVLLDFQRWPHLLLVGPSGRGKSQALRSLIYALASSNPPGKALFLILAKKAEDWLAFQPSASCYGLLIQPEEQQQALAWLAGDLLQSRAEQGRRIPHIFLVVDDLKNIAARASLAGYLGEIASMGRAAGIHLLVSSQTTGKAGGLTQDIEQNLTARLIFGAADSAAAARYAGSGGLQAESVGIAPGDALLILDGQPQRVATGLCRDTSIAQLKAGDLPRPWNKPEQAKQAEQARTWSQASSSVVATPARSGGMEAEQPAEQASQNSQRLDPARPPTLQEQELIRQIFQETGSKRQTILRLYGHYNGKVFAYVTEALEGHQNAIPAYQQASKPAEGSGSFQAGQRATGEASQALLEAGILLWQSDTARIIQ